MIGILTLSPLYAEIVPASECGRLKSSIYYTPSLTEKVVRCGNQNLNAVKNYNGKIITSCGAIRATLNMEGAGTVFDQDGGAKQVLRIQGRNRYSREPASICPAGFGRGNVCLNPYKVIAAGRGYKTGDVIFVSRTKGMRYPLYPGQRRSDWATHDGNWIVGDSGSAIGGAGRFDFFSGFTDFHDPVNPLAKLGLGRSSNFSYCRVPENQARQVRTANNFPKLTPTVMAQLLNKAVAPRQYASEEFASPAAR